jgi:hypothetical protein
LTLSVSSSADQDTLGYQVIELLSQKQEDPVLALAPMRYALCLPAVGRRSALCYSAPERYIFSIMSL